jgi:hypothetical protein
MVKENRGKLITSSPPEIKGLLGEARKVPASSVRPADLPVFKEVDSLDYLK